MDDTKAAKATIADSARPAAASAMARLRSRGQVAGTYTVVLDRDWAREHLEVTEALERAKRLGSSAAELEQRKAALDAGRAEAVLEFQFRHCSPVRYETLLSEYRPTEEMRQEAAGRPGGQQPMWRPDFRPAFVEEVLIDPPLTRAEIDELFMSSDSAPISPAEASELFAAALMASNTVIRFEPRDL